MSLTWRERRCLARIEHQLSADDRLQAAFGQQPPARIRRGLFTALTALLALGIGMAASQIRTAGLVATLTALAAVFSVHGPTKSGQSMMAARRGSSARDRAGRCQDAANE